MKRVKTIKLAELLSKDLVFRDSTAKLFAVIERIPEAMVAIDFKGVSSMTMSFAHEYLTQKEASEKKIREINLSANVKKLFEAVRAPAPRFRTTAISAPAIHPIPI